FRIARRHAVAVADDGDGVIRRPTLCQFRANVREISPLAGNAWCGGNLTSASSRTGSQYGRQHHREKSDRQLARTVHTRTNIVIWPFRKSDFDLIGGRVRYDRHSASMTLNSASDAHGPSA